MIVDALHEASPGVRVARVTLLMAALLFAFTFPGCGGREYLSPKLPYNQLSIPYAVTQIGRSTSLEVLNVARDKAYQFDPKQVEQALLTQGDTVIAYSGRSVDTRKTWLNLVAFDEYRMTARRKYFFCIDEQAERVPDDPRKLLFPPYKGILFDAQFVIDSEVLTTPYATEEAQRIAILQWLAGRLERDVVALVGDAKHPVQGSDAVTLSGMMANQVFQGVLVQLDKSPGLAKSLAEERGVAFPHISLGEGRIRLVMQNDLGTVQVRVNFPMVPSR
ncbi:MAG TPA: hypothetical protein PK373_07525 [Sedimentisphaerales bacterium]|nr:hypothetical protein [Sedimentisphaerales bacterium]HQG48922.1 hypothetical protein [Sedimentisphaerales bacterium]HQI27686.1 hypothetical protein [Sedimentisphaerales bacterium]